MAQKIIIEQVDDLDGTVADDVRTVDFSLDGVEYEIDLTEGNANQLRHTLEEFVNAARRTGGRRKRHTAAGATAPDSANSGPGRRGDREKNKAVRAWARNNGHKLSERGRIPDHVTKAYEDAQGKKTTRSTPSATPAPAKPSTRAAKPKPAGTK